MGNTVTIGNISYVPRGTSTSKLIEFSKQVEGQTFLNETRSDIDDRNYTLSTRNGANAYIIPTEKEKVYLNFIAQKTRVKDSVYKSMLLPEFEYFVDEIVLPDEPFILSDGIFFRCASPLPKAKEDYVYYLMIGGKGRRIPNYKTLEVMLAERGQTTISIRVLEEKQCGEIIKENGVFDDNTGAWTEDMADVTSIEALKKMEDNAKSAGAIAEGAKAEAAKQIDVVKKQAEAAKAEAEAEKAKAEAAKAEAAAAAAASAAAIAQAEAAKAEAEAAKAEFESKGN